VLAEMTHRDKLVANLNQAQAYMPTWTARIPNLNQPLGAGNIKGATVPDVT